MRSSRSHPAWCLVHSRPGRLGRNSKSSGAGAGLREWELHQPAPDSRGNALLSSLSGFQASPLGWWARVGAVRDSLPPGTVFPMETQPPHPPWKYRLCACVCVCVCMYVGGHSILSMPELCSGGAAALPASPNQQCQLGCGPSVLLLSHSGRVFPPSFLS